MIYIFDISIFCIKFKDRCLILKLINHEKEYKYSAICSIFCYVGN